MFPAVISVADVLYRSFYDEQEYRLRMRDLAEYAEIRNRAGHELLARVPRVAALSAWIRPAASAAVSAIHSFQLRSA